MSSTMPHGIDAAQPGRSSTERSVSAARFSDRASQFVSNRPIWLGDAPQPFAALPPMISAWRIVRSRSRRSRLHTRRADQIRIGAACRRGHDGRSSRACIARRSPADELKPSASSSSRYASRPASDVTTEPRTESSLGRSKSGLRMPSCVSPAGSSLWPRINQYESPDNYSKSVTTPQRFRKFIW